MAIIFCYQENWTNEWIENRAKLEKGLFKTRNNNNLFSDGFFGDFLKRRNNNNFLSGGCRGSPPLSHQMSGEAI